MTDSELIDKFLGLCYPEETYRGCSKTKCSLRGDPKARTRGLLEQAERLLQSKDSERALATIQKALASSA